MPLNLRKNQQAPPDASKFAEKPPGTFVGPYAKILDMKKRVGVLLGGVGSEREISLKTGTAFIKSLTKLGYPFDAIDVDINFPQIIATKKIDCALLALHGKYGEDGTVQGILEYLKIPYSGSGVMASALGMNKVATKRILTHVGVPTPEFQLFDFKRNPKQKAQLKLQIPIVVKPNNEGSTVGVTIVQNQNDFDDALKLAKQFDPIVLVEKFIDGKELTVPIWIDKALPIIEIVPKGEFYDYTRKYTAGQTEYLIPAEISQEASKKCADYALETFKAVGCRQYARVDIRLDKKNNPFVLEINTLPGCTETSLFPKSAAKVGLSFENIVETLVESATLDYT